MSESEMTKKRGSMLVYNPVELHEVVGTAFLGILAIVLLIALLRSQARLRKLSALHGHQ